MLGTPPAFILSQDQTLKIKLSCQASLADVFLGDQSLSAFIVRASFRPPEVPFHSSERLLWNLKLFVWNFRVVSLFNCQGSYAFFTKCYAFLNKRLLIVADFYRSSLVSITQRFLFVKHFFYFFAGLLQKMYLLLPNRFLLQDSIDSLSRNSVLNVCHCFYLWLSPVAVIMKDKSKRRKRDLNPRAAQATYTLSRGASSASWVFLLTELLRCIQLF